MFRRAASSCTVEIRPLLLAFQLLSTAPHICCQPTFSPVLRHTHAFTHLHTHTHTRTFTHLHTQTHTHTHLYSHAHTHTHTHTHTHNHCVLDLAPSQEL